MPKQFYELRVRIHNPLFSSQLTNGPNKLVLHYTRLKKASQKQNTLAYSELL